MRIRRFNQSGLEEAAGFLDRVEGSADPEPVPADLLTDKGLTEDIGAEHEVVQRPFATKLEMATYLDRQLGGLTVEQLTRDAGLWTWLALFYFGQLCARGTGGVWKPGDRARWVPAVDDYRKYYRHLVAGPCRIYRIHHDNPERALALLCGRLDRHGEVTEQLAAYQELITNRAVIELATRLYYDRSARRLKAGAASKGPGSARRLIEVLNQFDVTWDLFALSTEDLLRMLPDEFARFAA